jgi:hypothetical protein
VSAYIAQLKAAVAAEEARQAVAAKQAKQAALEFAKERMTPLDERLKRVLKTIPDEMLSEGVSLASIKVCFGGAGAGIRTPASWLRRFGAQDLSGCAAGRMARASAHSGEGSETTYERNGCIREP